MEKPKEEAQVGTVARAHLSPMAQRIRDLSVDAWGEHRAIEMLGESDAMCATLEKIGRFAPFREPIMITGESGVGKENVAHACHLLSTRRSKPIEVVNCPQYQDGNLTVSELFGHVKGSFTGAVSDHKGHFESADKGTIFLDEVADLHINAQTMLLRTLAEGEFKPVGSNRTVRSDVRVISATNRPLGDLIHTGEFREDLYFRLRFFPVEVPPLRDRGDDWLCIINFLLEKLAGEYGVSKHLSARAINFLSKYKWPGNIREVKSLATISFSMAPGTVIEPEHFAEHLNPREIPESVTPVYITIYSRMVKDQESFWDVLYSEFMNREISRSQASAVIRKGLVQTRNSYRGLVKLFNMEDSDYQRFMDFLRHQRLKPEDIQVSASTDSSRVNKPHEGI